MVGTNSSGKPARRRRNAEVRESACDDALSEARDMAATVQNEKARPLSPGTRNGCAASSIPAGNMDIRQSGRGDQTAPDLELNKVKAEAARLAAENEHLKAQMEKEKQKRKEKERKRNCS